jgi:hypothetical protein
MAIAIQAPLKHIRKGEADSGCCREQHTLNRNSPQSAKYPAVWSAHVRERGSFLLFFENNMMERVLWVVDCWCSKQMSGVRSVGRWMKEKKSQTEAHAVVRVSYYSSSNVEQELEGVGRIVVINLNVFHGNNA